MTSQHIQHSDPDPAPAADTSTEAAKQPVSLGSLKASGDRPSWLPEKFKSPEDMAKAYGEMEKKLSTPKDVPEQPSPLDFDSYREEYKLSGSLSEGSIQALVSGGIPRGVIDSYVAGVQAVGEAQTREVYDSIGGQEKYTEMLDWATANLGEGEVQAYNNMVDSEDRTGVLMAVKGLYAQYLQGGGSNSARMIQPDSDSGAAATGFRSVAELTTAMQDPRYAKDPAYRHDIEERLKRSDILGVRSR